MLKVILLALAIVPPNILAETIWRIGVDETNQRGRENANEFDAQANFHQSQYSADLSFQEEVDNPGALPLKFPGYLDDSESFKQVCTRSNYRCKDHSRDYSSAEVININVDTGDRYCTNVTFTYHRHGTEIDEIAYDIGNDDQDPVIMTFLGGAEAQHATHSILLPDIPGGEFTVSLRYIGQGLDNGHFIDFMKLTGDCQEIPM